MPMRGVPIGCVKGKTVNTHLVAEHLINMCVHGDTNILPAWQNPAPVGQGLECIMYESDYVALLAGWKA